MKAFAVPDEGYINQAVVSFCSFFKYNHIDLIIYAEIEQSSCNSTERSGGGEIC